MAPAGARVRFLASKGQRNEALQLIRDTQPFTDELETSAWQRFLFYRDSSVALDALDRPDGAREFREKAIEVASAFDQRNGNQAVSAMLD